MPVALKFAFDDVFTRALLKSGFEEKIKGSVLWSSYEETTVFSATAIEIRSVVLRKDLAFFSNQFKVYIDESTPTTTGGGSFEIWFADAENNVAQVMGESPGFRLMTSDLKALEALKRYYHNCPFCVPKVFERFKWLTEKWAFIHDFVVIEEACQSNRGGIKLSGFIPSLSEHPPSAYRSIEVHLDEQVNLKELRIDHTRYHVPAPIKPPVTKISPAFLHKEPSY